jgi:hypothetical protein
MIKMSSQKKGQLKIAADLYKGMPQVQIMDSTGAPVNLEPAVDLKKGEEFNVNLDMTDPLRKRLAAEVNSGKVQISLEALEVDLQHNQSFGMVAASTGCISNPGGPSC